MCLYVDYDDMTVTLSTGFRKARLNHQCGECRRKIKSGEQYFYQSVTTDMGGMETYKMCTHCRATIALASEMTGCPENWYWEMAIGTDEETHTGDALTHQLQPGNRMTLLRCIVGRRRQWYDRHGQLMAIPG